MNYATLTGSVSRALARDDIDPADLASWVRSATARLNRDLRIAEMLVHRVLPLTATRFPVPVDFLHVHEITLARNPAGAIVQGSSLGPLIYAPPDEISAMSALSRRPPNVPGYYTKHGKEIEVAPFTGTAAQISLWYFGKIKPLAEAADTNPILEEFEDLYLSAALIFGHRFYLERDEALVREGLVVQEISRLNDAFREAKYGDGPLVMRPAPAIGGRYR